MNDFQLQMNRAVSEFVTQITDLARRATIDTLEAALTGNVVRRGEKRSSNELDALATRFRDFVKDNPGLRIEQINKQLGTTTKNLALPIRKLLAEGTIHVKGQKRSTTYFAGSSSPKKKTKKG